MIVHVTELKNSTGEAGPLINTFSKIAGYKTNTEKSVVLYCTNGKLTEKKYQGNNTFHSSLKKM